MSIKINYSSKKDKNISGSIVLFVNEKFNTKNIKKYITESDYKYINEILKTNDLKKDILVFEINSKKKIVLISVKNKLKISEVENLGAKFYGRISPGKNCEYFIASDTLITVQENFLGHFLHGFKLKSYEFKKYKTKKEKKIISIIVSGNKNKPSDKSQLKFKAIEEGTFYARDLVSEPGNVLHPDEYARRLKSLKEDGLKVNIYDNKKLKKLGMHALLGVGQGSVKGSYLVTI